MTGTPPVAGVPGAPDPPGAPDLPAPVLHLARWLLPVAAPPIAGGALLVDGRGCIVAAGNARELRAEFRGAVRDHGEAVILPGLVNAHTHLELSALRGRAGGGGGAGEGAVPGTRGAGDFGAWLAQVTLAARALPEEAIAAAAESAIEELVASGTVLVGDVGSAGNAGRRGRIAAALAAAPGLRARLFHELIGFDPRDAEARFDAARRALVAAEGCGDDAGGPGGTGVPGDAGAAGGTGVSGAAGGPGGNGVPGDAAGPGAAAEPGATRIRHALAAHAPYSVSAPLLQLIQGFDARQARPSSIHLAESPAEDRFLMTGSGPLTGLKERLGTALPGWEPPGRPAAAHLAQLGWFESPGIAVHCVQLDAHGIELLRRSGGFAACLCPRSNANLGVGTAPAAELAAAGVPLALGTDSLASAESLSLFDELAAAARAYPGLTPAVLLRAATLGGAVALGFGAELGSLEAGKRAAALVVGGGGAPIADPFELLLGRPRPGQIRRLDRHDGVGSRGGTARRDRHGRPTGTRSATRR